MASTNRRTQRLHVQLDVDYYDDPKIIDAGEKAELLYVRSLAFCKKNWRANGYMSDGQVARAVAPGLPGLQARIKSLVATGLWERVDDDLFGHGKGYVVSAWLKRNPSADEIEHKRRADSDRKKVAQ